VDQLADRSLGQPHDLGNLGPAPALDGGLHQGVLLPWREVRHRHQGGVRQHPPFGDLVSALADRIRFVEIGWGG
jgi:hypothetical protein